MSALFLSEYQRLVRLAWLMVGDHDMAEDVVQDAFLALGRRWAGIRDEDKALFYLRAAVANGSRDRLRHRKVVRERMSDVLAAPAPAAETVALDHLHRDDLHTLIQGLPLRQRQVVVLRYYESYSEAQIAECLGISPGSVKAHAARGVATLAARLEGIR